MHIGFFDSGLGGLAILRETAAALPLYDYLYYGDTAHVPYGDRPEEEIYELTKRGMEYLFAHDCAIVVIACNTASAETLRRLQDTYLRDEYPKRRILGVVIPTIEELIQSGAERALLLATRRTVNSRKYETELEKRNITHLSFAAVAAPDLVPLIERGDLHGAAERARALVEGEGRDADTVVLGCTHYALLKADLRDHFMGVKRILSQDEIIPRKLAQYLMRHPELESLLTKEGKRTVHLTGSTGRHDPRYALLSSFPS